MKGTVLLSLHLADNTVHRSGEKLKASSVEGSYVSAQAGRLCGWHDDLESHNDGPIPRPDAPQLAKLPPASERAL